MDTDFTDANELFQLIVDQRQEAIQSLSQAQEQNQILFTLLTQQQELLIQQQQLIDRLMAELQRYHTNQQQTFSIVHTN